MSMFNEAIKDWEKVIEYDPPHKKAMQNKIDEANVFLGKKK